MRTVVRDEGDQLLGLKLQLNEQRIRDRHVWSPREVPAAAQLLF
jgi:hypothetical protein